MSWTPVVNGNIADASDINDLQTEKVDRDGAVPMTGTLELLNSGLLGVGGIKNQRRTSLLSDFQHPTGGGAVPVGYNLFLGGAGNFTTGATATQVYHASGNIGIGLQALSALTIGYYNVAYGLQALISLTTGVSNVAIGYQAAYSSTTANKNIAIGQEALRAVTTETPPGNGEGHIAIGYRALYKNTTGHHNVGIGEEALYENTAGWSNIAIGSGAMYKNVDAHANIAIGVTALYSYTGDGSGNSGSMVAIGWQSLYAFTDGRYCTAVGSASLMANTTGWSNTAIGHSTLYSLNGTHATPNGEQNVALGDEAGYFLTTGSGNIHIGYRAGYGVTTGNAPTTDTYGILIGWKANRSVATAGLENYIGIGNGVVVAASNTVVIGNGSITNTNLYGILTQYGAIYNTDDLKTLDKATTGWLTWADRDTSGAEAVMNLAQIGNIYPGIDNSYYLGKNDDDSPLAWKGVILKDTTNGKYYRIEVISGTITATDLTD